MAFNMRRTPMDNLAFRQAIATLIDREFLAEGVFQGIIVPMYSAVPDSNPFWHNPNVKIYGQGMTRAERIAEAVRILKAAGFSWDAEPKVVNAGTRDEAVVGILPDGRQVPLHGGSSSPMARTARSWSSSPPAPATTRCGPRSGCTSNSGRGRSGSRSRPTSPGST